MKTSITLVLFFMVTFLVAQENAPMEIYTFQQLKTEHPQKPEQNKTTIFVSGVQGKMVLDIKLVLSEKGIESLRINNQELERSKITDFNLLTDCITDYAEMPRAKVSEAASEPAPTVTVPLQDVNDYIIAALKEDGYITDETMVFDIVIAYEKMYFNGKAQSESISKKYKELYEEKSQKKLEPTTYYHFSQTL